ncbi:MAG: murein L,D-transpeptidase catalytic domain-containing protein [Bacteriovoracia bacterium]
MKFLSVLLWPLLIHPALAAEKGAAPTPAETNAIISKQIAKQFAALGGSPKALKHLGCFLKNQRNARFGLKEIKNKKDASTVDRCNKVEGGKAEISLHREDYALVVDYTRPPTSRRMYLIPLSGKGKVESYYAGHGRFGETPRNTEKATVKGNAINSLKLFSNKPNSNATATGFYIAGHAYVGKYDGPKIEKVKKLKNGKTKTITVKEDPKHPKFSLVLHGIEPEVNDNACNRATVIHGTSKISEAGKNEGVHLMSSGCPMVDYRAVNRIVESLKGERDQGGAAILSFGPREAALDDDYYCEMRPGQKPSVDDSKKSEVKPGDDKADDEDATPEEDDKSDEPVKADAHDPLDQ